MSNEPIRVSHQLSPTLAAHPTHRHTPAGHNWAIIETIVKWKDLGITMFFRVFVKDIEILLKY
jgi:hypothetical protein